MVTLKRVNAVLAIIAICTSLFCAGTFIYTKVSKLENSSVIKELEGN